MAKKQKQKHVGKGLKGALSNHFQNEKLKLKQQSAIKEAITKKFDKERSIKSGKGNRDSKKRVQDVKALIPFAKNETLLLVGEGDFSFATSIIRNSLLEPSSLIATSYDSLDEVLSKYPGAKENIEYLKEEGCIVMHEIDATDLALSMKLVNSNGKTKGKLFSTYKKLDHIMFNFPHTGRGMKDVDRNIRDHQKLVLGYFKSALELIKLDGQTAPTDLSGYGAPKTKTNIILSLFEGEPYISWGVKALARSVGLCVQRSGKFEWSAFEGYHHKRTNGVRDTTKPAAEREARIYIFDQISSENGQKGKQVKGKQKRDVESDSDDD